MFHFKGSTVVTFMTSCSFLFLAVVHGQDWNATNNCSGKGGSCVECVTAGCAWAIGLCQDDCDNFPLPCYSLNWQGVYSSATPEGICEFQQQQSKDKANCGIQTTCESCTSTVLTASTSDVLELQTVSDGSEAAPETCSWYEDTQTCSNLVCDTTGCSSPYCPSSLEGECYFGADNCIDCLGLTISSGQTCTWTGDSCELECKEGDNAIACFNAVLFGGTTQQICAAAAVVEADTETCLSQPDCSTCITTLVTDGSTCQWYYDRLTGISWCSIADKDGCDANDVCGVDSCEGIPDTSNNLGSNCLGLSTLSPLDITCEACLSAECGWTTVGFGGGQCLSSCNVIADAPCYEASSATAASTICAQASAEAADADICRAEVDCTTCVSTLKSDRTSTCQWYGNITDGTGYCGTGSACDQQGFCPSQTCDPNAVGSTGGSSLCDVLITCTGCLNNPPCVWIGNTCQENCEALPGEICYTESNPDFTGQFFTAICDAAETDAADSNRDIATAEPTSAAMRTTAQTLSSWIMRMTLLVATAGSVILL